MAPCECTTIPRTRSVTPLPPYHPVWAEDLWPHLLIWQNFHPELRTADFSRIDWAFTVTVFSQAELSQWLPSREMCLMSYFLLRDEKMPEHRSLWVGLMIHSSNPHNYRDHIGREQQGDVFYRGTITDYGPPLKFNEPRKITLDVKQLLRRAIGRFDEVKATLSRDPDAYSLRAFNFGWESLGHWKSEIALSGLSLRGFPVPHGTISR